MLLAMDFALFSSSLIVSQAHYLSIYKSPQSEQRGDVPLNSDSNYGVAYKSVSQRPQS